MSLLNFIHKKIDEFSEMKKAEKAELEEKMRIEQEMIKEVESLPIFKGRRANSEWCYYSVKVTPKNAKIVIERANQATERFDEVITPWAFHEAWEEANWYISHLASIESKLNIKGELPSSVFRRMKLQYNQKLIEFLGRYHKYHIEDRIKPLKTKRGKLNRAKEFLQGLDDIWGNMTQEAKTTAENMYKAELEMIENGEI